MSQPTEAGPSRPVLNAQGRPSAPEGAGLPPRRLGSRRRLDAGRGEDHPAACWAAPGPVDTTDTDRYESDLEFERRVADGTAAAEAAVTEARAAEALASGAVDHARGRRGLGEIEVGTVLILQRDLAQKQEATAVAQAVVKSLARNVAQQRDVRDRIRIAAARRERVDREAVKAASQVEARRLWAEIWRNLELLDRLEGLPPLRSAGGSYDRAMGALGHLFNLFVVDAR